jgi:aerobic carbon-monoxide dehydrogenase medium subunit
MKPSAFEYIRPQTESHVLTVLQNYGDDAAILAGGQSLVPMMNFRLARPEVLVDVNDLHSLAGIHVDPDGSLVVGALTRQASLLSSSAARAWPLLVEGVRHIGHYPIRQRGTVGGSLAHADPAAELPALAVALAAVMVLRSLQGERCVAAAEFFQGPFTTARESGEMLIEIRIPPLPPGTTSAFEEFSRRTGDFAMVAAAVTVKRDEAGNRQAARIVLTGVGPTPMRVQPAEEVLLAVTGVEGIRDAARAASGAVTPGYDANSSSRLRMHLVRELVTRALVRAEA